jgi:type VI secretion system protein ImpC
MVAAVPIGFSPELLNDLRRGFVPAAPPEGDRNLLESGLCRYTGDGLYVYRKAVRNNLLDLLLADPKLGIARLTEVASFLHAYSQRSLRLAGNKELQDFFDAQMRAAHAFVNPDEAAASLAGDLNQLLTDRRFARARQLTHLIGSLALPLVFEQELLAYAAGLNRLLSSDKRGARIFFSAFDSPQNPVSIGPHVLPGLETLIDLVEGPRPDRVKTLPPLAYDRLHGDVPTSVSIPFRIGIIGDFSGPGSADRFPRPWFKDRRFVEIDETNFGAVLRQLRPGLRAKVPNSLSNDDTMLNISLEFQKLEDFEPAAIIRQVRVLQSLEEMRNAVLEKFQTNPSSGIVAKMLSLDRLIDAQLAPILTEPTFSDLEARWRELHYLVTQLAGLAGVRLAILDASLPEICKDLNRAQSFSSSHLYSLLYDEGLGTAGGVPFAIVLGDFAFGSSHEGIQTLQKISQIAEAAVVPFLTQAAPNLLGIESFAELPRPSSLMDFVDTFALFPWTNFRQQSAARFVALAAPRVLIRPPYGCLGFEEFARSDEKIGAPLWGNPVYSIGVSLARSFVQNGWSGGWKGSGPAVEAPHPYIPRMTGDEVDNWATDAGLSSVREQELSHLGLIPLAHDPATGCAMIGELRSANCDEGGSGLHDHLFLCRLAHYVRAMARDKSGPGMSAADFERYVTEWIDRAFADATQIAPDFAPPFGRVRVHMVPRPDAPADWWAILCPEQGPAVVMDLSARDETKRQNLRAFQRALAVHTPFHRRNFSYKIGAGETSRALPFTIGVLGDFANIHENRRSEKRVWVDVSRDNLSHIMQNLRPAVRVSVPDRINALGAANNLEIQLEFRRLDDFEPQGVVEQIEPLEPMLLSRRMLARLLMETERAEDPNETLTAILQRSNLPAGQDDEIDAEVERWKDELLSDGKLLASDIVEDLRRRLAATDAVISMAIPGSNLLSGVPAASGDLVRSRSPDGRYW